MNVLAGAPIRARLTFGYVAALAVLLCAYAAGVYAYFRGAAYARLDDRLRGDYEVFEHLLEPAPGGGFALRADMHADSGSAEALVVEVWDESGARRLRWPDPEAVESIAAFGPPVGRSELTVADAVGKPWRVREGTESVGGSTARLRVARSEALLRDQLSRLRLGLGVGLSIALGLAGGAGYLLARRALAPVAQMAARAARISAHDLGERLPVANPTDELGRLGSVFNETLTRLQGSFEQLRRFTSDASHELRTPLTAIRAVGEVAIAEPREAGQYRETIGSMLEEADRLSRLVDSLLTLARADAGEVQLSRTRCDLAAMAKEVATHLEVLAEEKAQRIEVDAGDPVPVAGDPVFLRQAVVNLLDNAIKHAPERSTIHVRVSVEGSNARLEVQDSGPGIPPQHLGRIFDRFYRVDPSRSRNHGGAGLGLSIAKWSVEAHGGALEVESEVGRGSTFRIVLARET